MSTQSHTPFQLIQADGEPRYGVLTHAVDRVNFRDFNLTTIMDRKVGGLGKYLGFNQFQFIGLLSPNLIVGCAIVDLKLVSNAFLYLYSVAEQRLEEFSVVQPLALRTRITPFPDAGEAVMRARGCRFDIQADAHQRRRRLRVQIPKRVDLDVELQEPGPFEPLRLCTRAGYNGWVYTQKANALPVQGRLRWGDAEFDMNALDMLGGYDWSCGYMRRDTSWNWASLSCRLPDGRRLGFNGAAGTNETGFTENQFWLDDIATKIDSVHFDFQRQQIRAPWTLRSTDQRVQLRFMPAGLRQERRNLGVLASNFKQLFGTFHGTLLCASGERVELTDQWGFVEDHYARW